MPLILSTLISKSWLRCLVNRVNFGVVSASSAKSSTSFGVPAALVCSGAAPTLTAASAVAAVLCVLCLS